MSMPRRLLSALAAGLLAAPGLSAAEWVSVKGHVTLPPPKAPAGTQGAENVTVDKPACLKNGQLDKNVLIINPKNNGVKNVVVWLRPDSKERSATLKPEEINPALAKAAPKNHVVDQPCCQFEPRVLAVRVGDTLEVKNSAAINHNIKYDGPDSFNVNLPPGMSFKKPLPFQESRVPIPFSCSIHPWMAGRIRVFDQPYFAVTDANGDFEIKDAPAGKYNLVYWHELGFHKGRDGILGFTEELKGPVTNVKPIELELPQ